jgi:hypothetical protein
VKVYLANLSSVYKDFRAKLDKKLFVLESFYYVKPWMYKNIETKWDFLLDSGAFTFMVNASKSVDWDEYVSEYAAFINKHNVKHFFELDIDNVVGLKEVERLRTKLEILTKKKCIPVWHKSRGKQYWIDMTKEYDYVAIGGIVSGEIKKNEYKYFTWLLNEAKKNNCKVHGLGFTNLKGLEKYKFYSVDSTSWLCGNISGSIYRFNGSSLTTSKSTGRLKPKLARENNLNEWIKFQRYAEHNL